MSAAGAITLGSELPPGDYILQVVVRDTLVKEKQQIVTQYLQFEVSLCELLSNHRIFASGFSVSWKRSGTFDERLEIALEEHLAAGP